MSAPGYAGSQYIVDINASTGAFINIVANSTVRRLFVAESPLTSTGAANTLVGLLQYKVPNDGTTNGFTTVFEAVGANTLTTQGNPLPAEIIIGSDRSQHMPMGEIIGQLAQPIVGLPAAQQAAAAATTMMQIRSGTANGTSVTVIEYN
jgi:hypothetical protein